MKQLGTVEGKDGRRKVVGGCFLLFIDFEPVDEYVTGISDCTACQTYGYLPGHRMSPSIDRCQIILLGDRELGCEQLSQSRYAAARRPEVKHATS